MFKDNESLSNSYVPIYGLSSLLWLWMALRVRCCQTYPIVPTFCRIHPKWSVSSAWSWVFCYGWVPKCGRVFQPRCAASLSWAFLHLFEWVIHRRKRQLSMLAYTWRSVHTPCWFGKPTHAYGTWPTRRYGFRLVPIVAVLPKQTQPFFPYLTTECRRERNTDTWFSNKYTNDWLRRATMAHTNGCRLNLTLTWLGLTQNVHSKNGLWNTFMLN